MAAVSVMSAWFRPGFVAVILAAAGLSTAGAALAQAPTPKNVPKTAEINRVRIPPIFLAPIRRSVLNLTPARLASLRRGVAQMKAWNSAPRGSANFRRSWIYWANMHAYFGAGCASATGLNAAGMSGLSAQSKTNADEMATWCTCQHGTIQFLTWHRMYLYYFEKVLQAAAKDATLRLPFWDYETNAQLPPAYRATTYVNANGQTVANPLYVANRQAQLNAGTGSLTPSVVSTTGAMQATSYSPFNGAIEQTPHGAVHCATGVAGCPTGYMGAVPAAGNDPIFYAHHTNIDRLYECWLKVNPAARLPNTPSQLAATFTFIDGSGALVTRSVGDMLTTGQLGYSYATGGGCPTVSANAFAAVKAALQETPVRTFPVVGATPLKRGTTVIPIAMSGPDRAMLKSAIPERAGAPTRSRLVIDGLTFDEAPGVLYDVYLQGANGKRVLVGTINFFNQSAPHMEHDGMAMASAAPETGFDATDALNAVGDSAASLVIEPTTGVIGTTPAAAAERISPRANVRFSAVRIEQR